MKILDRYILSRFLYNFISSFVILMFIFIFQSIWFFIDELAGKGLDFVIIGKFLFYYSPNLVPQVLPLTVLLASIMTFGSFAENYEFAAMKASGISLKRAMRSLTVFIVFLSIGTFFFANNVIPLAEQKSFNLRRNIAKIKPALAITEGIFNDIGNINMKVDDKYGDNDKMLKNVIIHKKGEGGKNNTVIKANEGELVSSENSNVLSLKLKDGNYYQDIQSNNRNTSSQYPSAKAYFDVYIMNVDLSELNNVDVEQENGNVTHKMLNINELDYAIDSITTDNKSIITGFGENVHRRSGFEQLDMNIKPVKKDSVNLETIDGKQILELFEVWRRSQLVDMALNTVRSTVSTIEGKKYDIERRNKLLNHHKIAFHDKFALAVACIVLFFVGAPLGAIIRKGGMGLPMVIAIGLFLFYYFIGIFAKNYAEDGGIPPIVGSWISTLIMLPFGVLLTRRATADKSLIDSDKFILPIKNFFKKTYVFLDSL